MPVLQGTGANPVVERHADSLTGFQHRTEGVQAEIPHLNLFRLLKEKSGQPLQN